MALGALLIVSAVALSVYNSYDDKRAGEVADAVNSELYSVIEQNAASAFGNTTLPLMPEDMKTEVIDGREYIGTVSIPAMKAELPVQASLTDANLKHSPCRYGGNVFDGSLIIAAHNYKSHFGRLGTLKSGDAVIFTDVIGHQYKYKVVEIYQVGSSDVEEMEKQGSWDLTLFTCTYGNRQRVTVRCIRSE